jgi:hypothetical protein
MQPEFAPKRCAIIFRRHRIEQGMADKRTPNSHPAIEFFFERENHDDMIDTPLNPLHPTRPPSPNLRRNIIEDPEAGALGHPCEMKIESRVVDQDDKVPWLRLEHRPDGANAPDHRSNG